MTVLWMIAYTPAAVTGVIAAVGVFLSCISWSPGEHRGQHRKVIGRHRLNPATAGWWR